MDIKGTVIYSKQNYNVDELRRPWLSCFLISNSILVWDLLHIGLILFQLFNFTTANSNLSLKLKFHSLYSRICYNRSNIWCVTLSKNHYSRLSFLNISNFLKSQNTIIDHHFPNFVYIIHFRIHKGQQPTTTRLKQIHNIRVMKVFTKTPPED